MRIYRIIDKQTNLFIRDDFNFDEETEIGLDVEPAQGFYWPKWDGEKWIEAKTEEEIEAIKASVEPPMPTDADRIAALESAMLDMILGGA